MHDEELDLDAWQLENYRAAKERIAAEFEYRLKCESCRKVFDSVIPTAAGLCCFCWQPGDDVKYWARFWQFAFAECIMFNNFAVMHKAPSYRAIYALRRVVNEAPKLKGPDRELCAKHYEQSQQRRFAVIKATVRKATLRHQHEPYFHVWLAEMRLVLDAELVIQPYEKTAAPKPPEQQRKKPAPLETGQLKLFGGENA